MHKREVDLIKQFPDTQLLTHITFPDIYYISVLIVEGEEKLGYAVNLSFLMVRA